MSSTSAVVDCAFACHDEWVPLPLGPAVELSTWSHETAADLIHEHGPASAMIDPDRFAEELRSCAADSRGRRPVHALALCLPGIGQVAALLEVDFIHPDESLPVITSDWLIETFTVGDFGPPETATGRLAAGPAVRIRQNFAAAYESESGGRVLIEAITYGVHPPESGSAVVVHLSWTVPGVADLVERMAEDIVATLRVTIG